MRDTTLRIILILRNMNLLLISMLIIYEVLPTSVDKKSVAYLINSLGLCQIKNIPTKTYSALVVDYLVN